MKLYFWDWGKYKDRVVRADYSLHTFGPTKAEADENFVFTNLNSAIKAGKEDLEEKKARFMAEYNEAMGHLDSLSPDTVKDVDSVGV